MIGERELMGRQEPGTTDIREKQFRPHHARDGQLWIGFGNRSRSPGDCLDADSTNAHVRDVDVRKGLSDGALQSLAGGHWALSPNEHH